MEPSDATLLGSPIGDTPCITSIHEVKIGLLQTLGDRLQYLAKHDAPLLLRHSFALPQLLYILRTSPCFLSEKLNTYDDVLKSIKGNIFNICFVDNESAQTQATLPVKFGGLGVRSAVQLAPSTFLASAFIHHILPAHLHDKQLPSTEAAFALRSLGHNNPPPDGLASQHQKSWDSVIVSKVSETLLANTPDSISRARLLGASSKEKGAWLNALPISSLGLRMDDETIREAVGLRLGSNLCRPHLCQHCEAEVNELAIHGLCCRWSEGCHHRHSVINDIIHHALTAA